MAPVNDGDSPRHGPIHWVITGIWGDRSEPNFSGALQAVGLHLCGTTARGVGVLVAATPQFYGQQNGGLKERN